MKINIYGGGLSGLTVAFELMDKGHEITIYEKEAIVGGMSKSKYKNGMPTEHSWRGYGPFYHNMFDILKRIEVTNDCNNIEGLNLYTKSEISKHNTRDSLWCYYKGDVYDLTSFVNKHPGGSIILKAGGQDLEKVWEEMGVLWHLENNMVKKHLDEMKIGKLREDFDIRVNTAEKNLVNIDFNLLFQEKKTKNYGKNFKVSDILKITYSLSKFVFSNNRSKGDYIKLVKPQIMNNLSKEAQIYIFDFLSGPGYGFDINSISRGHICLFSYYNIISKLKGDFKWSVSNKPTNETFINDMVKTIKENGVTVNLNSKLEKINILNEKVDNCIVNGVKCHGDIHVFCLDPFSFSDILSKSNIDNTYYDKLNTVNNQISFRIGLNKEIRLSPDDKKNVDGFVLVDSAYNITFHSQTDTWCDKKYMENNKGIKTLWSGTIIQPFRKGNKYSRSALGLTVDKLKEEIIYDFVNSKDLKDIISNLNNGHNFSNDDIIWFEIYDDWYYNKDIGRLETRNKKWVNNIYNENYRPDGLKQFNNMYIGGAHTRTSVNIWSMEGAIESGKMIAKDIMGPDGDKIYHYKHGKDPLSRILGILDDVLYYFGLPHIVDVIIFIIFIIIFLLVLRKIIAYRV